MAALQVIREVLPGFMERFREEVDVVHKAQGSDHGCQETRPGLPALLVSGLPAWLHSYRAGTQLSFKPLLLRVFSVPHVSCNQDLNEAVG